jgi:hypothetical protein
MKDLMDDTGPIRIEHRQTQVVIQFPAVTTEILFMGLRVFLESTGDPRRDAQAKLRFEERINKLADHYYGDIFGTTKANP